MLRQPATVPQALASVRRGGTVALLGLTGGAKVELEVDRLALDEIDLLGIRSSPNAYPAMIDLLATGAVTAKPLAPPTSTRSPESTRPSPPWSVAKPSAPS